MILNYRDRLNQVSIMKKTILDNYVTDRTNTIYVENENKLPLLIGPSTIYDKNQIGQ